MFVCSISADGAQLIGSTYLGGSNNEGFNDSLRFNYGDGFRGEIEVQTDGGPVYIAAYGRFNGLSHYSRRYRTSRGLDGVLTVLPRNMGPLIYSTHLGTSGHEVFYSLSLISKEGNTSNSSRVFLSEPLRLRTSLR